MNAEAQNSRKGKYIIKNILLLFFFFNKPLGRLQSLHLMKKQQEVNRTDIAGYRNIEEKILWQYILTNRKENSTRGEFLPHQKMRKL